MPDLPDELLLAVFRRLPKLCLLLAVRGVSRRWRRLALDHCLWRRHVIPFSRKAETAMLRSTLLLAPCLQSLRHLDVKGLSPSLLKVAVETPCAITRLELWCRDTVEPVIRDTALPILRRQIELGALRSVGLQGVTWGLSTTREMAEIALSAPLTALEISVTEYKQRPASSPPYVVPSHRPSLKSLTYNNYCHQCDGSDALLEGLIAAHAETLESVSLSEGISNPAVALLGKCSKLRAARLPCIAEAECLSQCPLLQTLSLELFAPIPEVVPWYGSRYDADRIQEALVPFFRDHATSLRKLTFWLSRFKYICPNAALAVAVHLLGELASSGQSKLTRLQIDVLRSFSRKMPSAELEPLPRILTGLPLLTELTLGQVPPTAALDALTPSVIPCLRRLSLDKVNWKKVKCDYPDCCYPALFRLVRRNSRLHVIGVLAEHECIDTRDSPCPCCSHKTLYDDDDDEFLFRNPDDEEPFHRLSTSESESHCGLYGHPETEPCGVSASHLDIPIRKCPCWFCGECKFEWRSVIQ